MTGPLSEAVEAADALKDAARRSRTVDASLVRAHAERVVTCLREAKPPYGDTREKGGESQTSRLLRRLRERCDGWEDIYDKPYIATLDELQILEYAEALGVPPSWVRGHVEPRDIRAWGDFQRIKQQRFDEQSGSDDKVKIG